MKVQEHSTAKLNIFRPSGWLDHTSSLQFQDQLDDAIARGISAMVVDCRGIDYISSAGLRTISQTANRLKPVNGILILCSLEDYVEEVFEISGISALLVITENIDEAIHYLQGVGRA